MHLVKKGFNKKNAYLLTIFVFKQRTTNKATRKISGYRKIKERIRLDDQRTRQEEKKAKELYFL